MTFNKSSSNPLVSIIVPTYNSSKYLNECIDSILNQSYYNLEIIFIDDSSSDDTIPILQEYSKNDKRIKIFTQSHLGSGAARNLGINYSNGEFIFFLDSDDYINSDLVNICVQKMTSTDYDILIFDILLFDDIKKIITEPTWCVKKKFIPSVNPFSAELMRNHIFNTFSNNVWNKFFRKSFIVKNNISFQKIMRTTDLYFTCSLLVLAQKIYFLEERLIYYRVNNSSSCMNTNHLYPFNFISAFNYLKDFLVSNKIYNAFENSYINHKIDGAVFNLLSQNSQATFAELYIVLQNWLKKDLLMLKMKNIISATKFNIASDILKLKCSSFSNKYMKKIKFLNVNSSKA